MKAALDQDPAASIFPLALAGIVMALGIAFDNMEVGRHSNSFVPETQALAPAHICPRPHHSHNA